MAAGKAEYARLVRMPRWEAEELKGVKGNLREWIEKSQGVKEHAIELARMVEDYRPGQCARCGKVFRPEEEWQRFCSLKCQREYQAALLAKSLREFALEYRRTRKRKAMEADRKLEKAGEQDLREC